ncbi:MAG: ankyrin repeat domain-containing protein [Gemmatales bacterium]
MLFVLGMICAVLCQQDTHQFVLSYSRAVSAGDLPKCIELLEKCPRLIHQVTDRGSNTTLLHVVAEHGDRQSLLQLVKYQPDLGFKDAAENTAFDVAVKYGKLENAMAMVEVFHIKQVDDSCLYHCFTKNHELIARWLLEKKLNRCTEKWSSSVLRAYAYYYRGNSLTTLLRDAGYETRHPVSPYRVSLAHYAALAGNTRLVKELIESGSPETLYTMAAITSDQTIIKLVAGKTELLSSKEPVQMMGIAHIAVMCNNLAVLKNTEMIEKSVNHAPGHLGNRTPLHLAACTNKTEAIKCLVRAKADLSLKDSQGMTALHHACREGHTESCHLLLDYQCDANVIDDVGFTPLHYAATNDHLAIAELLVKHGASVFLKSKNGDTPISISAPSSKTRKFLEPLMVK